MSEFTINKDLEANRPDVSLANRIKAIFEDDPQIKMEYRNATHETLGKVTIHVYGNERKATAIKKLLKPLYDEIAQPLEVEVVDESGIYEDTVVDAFTGNPHFSEFINIQHPLDPTTVFHVCIFKKEVIQFKNDNGSSLHGYEFRLMEDLCKQIIDDPLLIFTTEDDIPRD